jgi:biopolymer transport protein ExbD
MPSVKMPRKSTDTDMTPFVDVAFLILSFFMLATKFKPPEPVQVTMPNSVSADKLKQEDAVLITIDKDSKVYFSAFSQKDPTILDKIIDKVATSRNINLTAEQKANFRNTYMVGVPFNQLAGLLDIAPADQGKLAQPGIPVLDSATNELVWWVSAAKSAFAGKKLQYMIKGDGGSKFPTFDAVISALKRNEEFKYNLITSPEDIPSGSDLEKANTKAQQSK